MKKEGIRLLLVDDSPLCLAILTRMLAGAPDIHVVGTARNGKEALDLLPRLHPQVVCTDLKMPVMDGLALTQAIMAQTPRPILVVSNYVQKGDEQTIFQLLEAGAVDVFPKPRGGDESAYREHATELMTKIRVLSGVVPFRKRQPSPTSTRMTPQSAGESHLYRLMVVGASTGGPEALRTIFSSLPKDFPLPILCVQHISRGFVEGLVDWLDSKCHLAVRLAKDGEIAAAGSIYFPPEGAHLEIDQEGRLAVSHAPPKEGHRPSVDVTFSSAARVYGSATIGMLLTGMGRDGAQGLLKIRNASGTTLAQDETSCAVFSMPRHAIELGAVSHVLPVWELAPTVLTMLSRQKAPCCK